MCDTTRKVVRSKRTTSSADSNSEKDSRCDSMTSIFGIRDCTIEDHAYINVLLTRKRTLYSVSSQIDVPRTATSVNI